MTLTNSFLNALKTGLMIHFTLWTLTGCQGPNGAVTSLSAQNGQGQNPPDVQPPSPSQPELPPEDGFPFCSKLNLDEVNWPEKMAGHERSAFSLALNITGSFEGHNGWSNLANNSDGQGISLGLLQQNLGQGTLQPVMIHVREKFADSYLVMEKSRLGQLMSMLQAWESSGPPVTLASQSSLMLNAKRTYSRLDVDYPETETDYHSLLHPLAHFFDSIFVQNTARNRQSVQWAVQVVHSGSSLRREWRHDLEALAQTPGYRSTQILAALYLHEHALRLFHEYDMQDLRSYLFFFDIVVQNGGINNESDKREYNEYIRANPNLNETQRLEKILELRVRRVREQYQEDVRSRKSSLIHGFGTVHRTTRNYPAEFCVDWNQPLRSKMTEVAGF